MPTHKHTGYWHGVNYKTVFIRQALNFDHLDKNIHDMNIFGFRWYATSEAKSMPSFYCRIENFNSYELQVNRYRNSLIHIRDALVKNHQDLQEQASNLESRSVSSQAFNELAKQREANSKHAVIHTPGLVPELVYLPEVIRDGRDDSTLIHSNIQLNGDFANKLEGKTELAPKFTPISPLAAWASSQKYDYLSPLSLEHFNNWTICSAQENLYTNTYLSDGIDYNVDYVDLALGVQAPHQVIAQYNNYLCFPTYIPYLVVHVWHHLPTLKEVKESFAAWAAKRTPEIRDRRLDLSLVARHDLLFLMPGVRRQIVEAYHEVFHSPPIFMPGEFGKNTNILHEEYNNDKKKFLEDCFVNICPENSWAPGYVTEKIWEAIYAGCMPVYWGNLESEKGILNPDAFIMYNPRDKHSFQVQIYHLFTSEQYRNELISRNPFVPGAAQRFFCRYIYPLVHVIRSQIGSDIRILTGQSEIPVEELHYEEDFLQAQQELLEMGQELETGNDHLLDDRNKWPYTSEEKKKLDNFTRHLDWLYNRES